MHYKLIERFAPPSILVNGKYDIVHMSDEAGNFLQFSGGEPTRNLLQLVHPMLRLDLRAALFSAAESQRPVDASNVVVDLNGDRKVVDLSVFPAGDLAPEHLLVKFDLHPLTPEMISDRMRNSELDEVSHQLELELERTKTQLRNTIEQSEASTEELKASNEELQAMNEELRSATEELETSREELQSINEELATVNLELKNKVEELGHSNSDLHVLMAATAIATIFLDRDLRILRYTPPAVELFNLIPTDMGRPLSDLTHRLDYPEIERDARRALGELVPSEREVQAGGRWFLARTLPYRTADDRIGGVVLTFVDITERRQAVDTLRELQEEQAADLAATLKLQEVSSRLLSAVELPPLLRQLLDATIEMQRADFGCVQLYNPALASLRWLRSAASMTSLLRTIRSAWVRSVGCERPLDFATRGRIVVSDVNEEEVTNRCAQFAAEAGYRAVHSTPLFDRNDQPLGVLTTHFRQPHHAVSARAQD